MSARTGLLAAEMTDTEIWVTNGFFFVFMWRRAFIRLARVGFFPAFIMAWTKVYATASP